ncbi:Toxin RelG [termite gut metagenome]|uniref:Toxin RelG n=1 Tax=termite gut metagenome TaxID=433724 RepID=A0A5J4QDH6_9ZZZZ
MYKVFVSEKVENEVKKIPIQYAKKIVEKINLLSENPRPYGNNKLSGFDNLYRIRVGIYRIIYTIEDEILTVEVVKVDHRNSAYK